MQERAEKIQNYESFFEDRRHDPYSDYKHVPLSRAAFKIILYNL